MRISVAVTAVVATFGTARCTVAFIVGVPSRIAPTAASTVSRGDIRPDIQHASLMRGPRGDRRRRETALSMISATFGEKINTDKVVMDKTAAEVIGQRYPEAISKNTSFLEEIGHGYTGAYTEEELLRKLELAHVFVSLANLVILSRGKDILSGDFKYYSPGTGRLDRDAFLRLTKTIDVAFSTFKVYPTDFTVYKDGVVSYRQTIKALHDGYLNVGDKTYPPTNTKVVSDVDLCTVSFDPAGLVQSYTYGLMVESIANVENPEAIAEIADIEKRVESQTVKLKSLEGQESSIAYSKCQADIETLLMDKEVLEEKASSAANTRGLGGIPGIFAAVGAEFPSDVRHLEGTDAYGEVEGGRPAVFSFPSEVRGYSAFDENSFQELQE